MSGRTESRQEQFHVIARVERIGARHRHSVARIDRSRWPRAGAVFREYGRMSGLHYNIHSARAGRILDRYCHESRRGIGQNGVDLFGRNIEQFQRRAVQHHLSVAQSCGQRNGTSLNGRLRQRVAKNRDDHAWRDGQRKHGSSGRLHPHDVWARFHGNWQVRAGGKSDNLAQIARGSIRADGHLPSRERICVGDLAVRHAQALRAAVRHGHCGGIQLF